MQHETKLERETHCIKNKKMHEGGMASPTHGKQQQLASNPQKATLQTSAGRHKHRVCCPCRGKAMEVEYAIVTLLFAV
jgi:hypothetical protein